MSLKSREVLLIRVSGRRGRSRGQLLQSLRRRPVFMPARLAPDTVPGVWNAKVARAVIVG